LFKKLILPVRSAGKINFLNDVNSTDAKIRSARFARGTVFKELRRSSRGATPNI
jgi:hypothetical protein